MDSRLTQQLAAIRTAEALERAAVAREARARTRPARHLTLRRPLVMIAMWRAGSRAR